MCRLAQQSLNYLGHIISSAGITTDPTKIQVIQNWPVPTTIRGVRGFLALQGITENLLKTLASLSSP